MRLFSCMCSCLQCHLWEPETKGGPGETATMGSFSSRAPFPQTDLNLLQPVCSLKPRLCVQAGDTRRRNVHLQRETLIQGSPAIRPLLTCVRTNMLTWLHVGVKVNWTAFVPDDVISPHSERSGQKRPQPPWWLKDGAKHIHNGKFL